jgi:hypothetical protein
MSSIAGWSFSLCAESYQERPVYQPSYDYDMGGRNSTANEEMQDQILSFLHMPTVN